MEFREYGAEVEKLIIENQALVTHIAKMYNPTVDDFNDFVQIGMIGLIKAAYTFNESAGVKFLSYAGKIISNEIRMHLRKTKNQNCETSLDSELLDGENLTLADRIPSKEAPIDEMVANLNELKNVFYIILNILTPPERISLLFNLAAVQHRKIAPILKISQSWVARKKLNAKRKIINAINSSLNLENANYSVTFLKEKFIITFSKFDPNHFKRIVEQIQSFDTTSEFSQSFKVVYLEREIKLYLYIDKTLLLFLALFFTLYEGYSLECYSNLTELLECDTT